MREQFKNEIKKLAVEFWTMNLHDGTFEEKLDAIIDKYNKKAIQLHSIEDIMREDEKDGLYEIIG